MAASLRLEVPEVLREAVDAAFLVGDLETITAFFAQPHVLDDVVATNAFIVETAATDILVTTLTRRDGSVPWIRRPPAFVGDFHSVVPLVSAARNGHVHVIEWFFAQARVDRMAATLALLLRPIALVGDTRIAYNRNPVNGACVLETVLSSYTFQHVLSTEAQQVLLDDLIRFSDVEARVRVAIAHGARADQPCVVAAVATYGLKNTDQIDKTIDSYAVKNAYKRLSNEPTVLEVLAHEGMWVVGADVLHLSAAHVNPHAGARLVRLGIDWGNGTTTPLRIVAASLAHHDFALDYFVRAGFFDLDARDPHGVTALMITVAFPSVYASYSGDWLNDPAYDYAECLIDHGADVHAVDDDGCSVWDYARRGNNESVQDLLLEAFADVSEGGR